MLVSRGQAADPATARRCRWVAPANRSEPTAHEVVALAVDVFEEIPRNEVVVVQLHEDALLLAPNPADMGGILPDAGVPVGEPSAPGTDRQK